MMAATIEHDSNNTPVAESDLTSKMNGSLDHDQLITSCTSSSSTNDNGIIASPTSNVGIFADSTYGTVIFACSTNNTGELSGSTNDTRIIANSSNDTGILADSSYNTGILEAQSNSPQGCHSETPPVKGKRLTWKKPVVEKCLQTDDDPDIDEYLYQCIDCEEEELSLHNGNSEISVQESLELVSLSEIPNTIDPVTEILVKLDESEALSTAQENINPTTNDVAPVQQNKITPDVLQMADNETDAHETHRKPVIHEKVEGAKIPSSPSLKLEYVGHIWESYVSASLVGSTDITEAAIYDKVSRSCVACSKGFHMSENEFDNLVQSLNCMRLAYKTGITVAGIHYKTMLADGRRGLMARRLDMSGLSACQSRSLVIIALHDNKGKARKCNEDVMTLGDFFWNKGL